MNRYDRELSIVNAIVERRRRLRIIMLVLPAILGFLTFLLVLNPMYYAPEYRQYFVVATVSLIGTALFVFMLSYLQDGFNFDRQQEQEMWKRRIADEELGSSLNLAEDLSAANLHPQPRNSSSSNLENEPSIGQAARNLRAERNAQEKKQEHILEVSRTRLRIEVEALGRRGNINLALGASTSALGLIILGIVVYYGIDARPSNLVDFVSTFVPRLTLVVMIELFAFFFLSLYRTGLGEIKYFQNEITNIEAKHAALQASQRLDKEETQAAIILLLAGTERNNIMTKDQTTVELEKIRLEKTANTQLLGIIKDLMPGKTS